MTQFSIRWILSLNRLSQKWGQVHIRAELFKACLAGRTGAIGIDQASNTHQIALLEFRYG
jgi:hypothetical protein